MPTGSRRRESNYLTSLKSVLKAATPKPKLYQAIVNAPFADPLRATNLGLGILALALVDSNTKTINRIRYSETDMAQSGVRMAALPYEAIKIPLHDEKNVIAQVIRTQEPQVVYDWYYLFTPLISRHSTRLNQAAAGIEYTIVVPLARKKGVLIFDFFRASTPLQAKQDRFVQAYTKLVNEAWSSS